MSHLKTIVIRFSPIDNIDLAPYHSNLTTINRWPLDFAGVQPYALGADKTKQLIN